jgi:hypothetical protein
MTVATSSAGTLVGPAGGTWEQGMVARAQCVCCRSWVIGGRVWSYWVALVKRLTVCAECANGGTT